MGGAIGILKYTNASKTMLFHFSRLILKANRLLGPLYSYFLLVGPT